MELKNIGHFDEVPAPFIFGNDTTHEFEGSKVVYNKSVGNRQTSAVGLFFNAGCKISPQILLEEKDQELIKKRRNGQESVICWRREAWQGAAHDPGTETLSNPKEKHE